MSELGICNTQLLELSPGISICSQAIDYLRIGPLSGDSQWNDIEQRYSYLAVDKTNHFGRWFVDFTGDALELVRTVEGTESILEYFQHTRWTRLDVAFDCLGVDIERLPRPGTTILNHGNIETVYSHHLKARGHFAVFARAYDAAAAGHDMPEGTVRFEVEFKRRMPDIIRKSEKVLQSAFSCAAFHVHRIYGVALPVSEMVEIKPPRRVLQHDREKFYARFGKAILLDVLTMGQDDFAQWLKLCIAKENDETRDARL